MVSTKLYVAGFLFLLGSSAGAFTLNSQVDPNLGGWERSVLNFDLNPSNCPTGMDVAELIKSSAKVWNEVATSRLKVGIGAASSATTYQDPPVVVCDPNFGTGMTSGADPNSIPGLALAGATNGRMAYGIIVLNVKAGATASIAVLDPKIVKIIIAHEIGHVLGLGHSEDTSALMYYNASAKTTLSLSQDDVDGITYLYPRDEFSKSGIMGCGTLIRENPDRTIPPMSFFIVLLMPMFVLFAMRAKAYARIR